MFNIQTVSKAGQIFKDSPSPYMLITLLTVHTYMYNFILLSNWAVYPLSTMDSDTSQL